MCVYLLHFLVGVFHNSHLSVKYHQHRSFIICRTSVKLPLNSENLSNLKKFFIIFKPTSVSVSYLMFIDKVSVQQSHNLHFNGHKLTFGQLGKLVTGLPHTSCRGQLFLGQTDEQTTPNQQQNGKQSFQQLQKCFYLLKNAQIKRFLKCEPYLSTLELLQTKEMKLGKLKLQVSLPVNSPLQRRAQQHLQQLDQPVQNLHRGSSDLPPQTHA